MFLKIKWLVLKHTLINKQTHFHDYSKTLFNTWFVTKFSEAL